IDLQLQAQTRMAEISESEVRIEALRKAASQAGESLLRLHGEQKQAEEALVHQSEALRKSEAAEHDLLELSIRLRADAEDTAHVLEAANGQLNNLKQQGVEFHAKLHALRSEREERAKESETLRDSLAGVRARHTTLTQILNDR